MQQIMWRNTLKMKMKYKIKSYRRGNWTSRSLDFWDDVKVRFLNFWDFKYKKERKEKKAMLKQGEMEKIPIKKAINKDVKEMGYKPNSYSSSMKYVKTKGGAVVVTPASMRDIRKDYENAELVKARIKSHQALSDENSKSLSQHSIEQVLDL